jgi:tRNA(fMet)-specific endonuclease VapC
MKYLLDTDTVSYAVRGGYASLDSRLATAKVDSLHVSAITRAELLFGLERRGNPRALARLVHALLDRVTVLSWDSAAADVYAKIAVKLEKNGTPIGYADTMIAAHALSIDATLVTNNIKHFQLVKGLGLQLENWAI